VKILIQAIHFVRIIEVVAHIKSIAKHKNVFDGSCTKIIS